VAFLPEHELISLDYRHRVRKSRLAMPISGTACFVALVFWVAWIGLVGMLDWFFWPHSSPAISRVEALTLEALDWAPFLISVCFGFYSVRVAGFTRRNPFGVMGLVLCLAVAFWAAGKWYWNGSLPLTMP
jgi:hypothetical protein